MKKFFLFIILSLLCKNLFPQEIIIIINGVQGNRPLTLNDFTGKPPAESLDDGNTSASVSYKFRNLKLNGDSVIIYSAVVTVEMNSGKSWIKEGREINYLLKHEQGHFDVKRLWGIALVKGFENISVPKKDMQNKIDAIAAEINKKYIGLDQLYDKETNHSKNKEQQEKWNRYFKVNLPD